MATSRRGDSVTGFAMALVVFVILFVITLVATILVYTMLDSAKKEAAKASQDLGKWVKSTERTQPDFDALLNSAGANSVAGMLLSENQALKTLLDGDPKLTLAQVRQDGATAGLAEGQPALAEIKRIRTENQALAARAKEMTDALDNSMKRLAVLEEAKKASDQELMQAQKQLEGKVQGLQDQQKSYEKTVAGERQSLQDQLKQVQNELQTTKTDSTATLDQLKQDNTLLRQRLADLQTSRQSSASGPDPSLMPDGQIISVSTDMRTVYINLGKKQHVTLGLTFNVYPRGVALAKSTDGELQPGKAIVEVVSVSENTCVARVIQVTDTISENDVVANVVYDPNQQYKFYVFGRFDLDHTGQPSDADHKRVEGMISQWGGKVQTDLSYDTDFLVIGEEPQRPEPLQRDVRDPRLIEEFAAKQRVWQEYRNLLTEADRYQIKVLNTNRFLNLVGYYQR